MADNKNMKNLYTPKLMLATFFTVFGSSFLYGYNMSVINNPVLFIQCFMNRSVLNTSCSINETDGTSLNLTEGGGVSLPVDNAKKSSVDAVFLYSLVSVIYVVAGAIGAFISGALADKIGRRNGLLFNHAFALLASLLISLTEFANSVTLLYVARFLHGLNNGITLGIAPMFLTEISPKQLRGGVGTAHQLAITLGIAFGYLVTMSFTLNSAKWWPLAAALNFIPALISLIIMPIFCPESPRFTFHHRANEQLARAHFAQYNSSDNVDVVFDELRRELHQQQRREQKRGKLSEGDNDGEDNNDVDDEDEQQFKLSQLVTDRTLRLPMSLACLFQIMQQLSGINAVISYSSLMLSTAGIAKLYNEYCVLIIGVVNVLCTIVSIYLIDKAGRRPLFLWPSLLVLGSLVALTITVNLVNSDTIIKVASTKSTVGTLSVVFIFVYIIGFAFGLGPVPSLIVSELFRQGPRAAAYSISMGVQWTANLIVLFSFPIMDKAIGGWSFLPFLCVTLVCWVFFFLYMPETKNRTFEETANRLAKFSIYLRKDSPQKYKISRNDEETQPSLSHTD